MKESKNDYDVEEISVRNGKSSKKIPPRLKKKIEDGKKLQTYLAQKKTEMKETRYRKKYDDLLDYIDRNLINTESYRAAMVSMSTGVAYSYVYSNGSYTQIPMIGRDNANNGALNIPVTDEPIAFSKILTATSVLAGKIPDAVFKSNDKIYARTQYELWKSTWANPLGNGKNTLANCYQSLLSTGVGFYRIFPKKIEHMHKGVKRIKFDGIYRMALNPRRTWIGTSVNLYDSWSYGEVFYEMDERATDFLKKHPEAENFQLEYASTNEESQIDDYVKEKFVVIKYYEDPIKNKYCVACGNYPIYEGEMPNMDGWGHVMWANCFVKDPNDPYGVGFVEFMRGNVELYNYINGLSAAQVEAEISPLIFGTNTGVGEMTYRRGPNVINPKSQGTELDIVKTSGNVQQSLIYADKQKQIISENTGINDILAGQAGEGTLGATVILREAALNRLIIPRGNMITALEIDAYATASWIRQTYPIAKMEFFSDKTEVMQFVQNNPGYFHTVTEEISEEGSPVYIAQYSKRVPMNFDVVIDETGENEDDIEEITDEYDLPASELFDFLKRFDHVSDRLVINIDPNSMLLPSEEINKQRMTELYSMVSPQTVQIFQMKQIDPNLARTMLKQLEHIIEINKESIFEWFPKDVYDEIMSPQPQVTPEMMAQQAMGQGGMGEGQNAPQIEANQIPAQRNELGKELSSSNTRMSTVNPMRDATNASIGRAAAGNLTPRA